MLLGDECQHLPLNSGHLGVQLCEMAHEILVAMHFHLQRLVVQVDEGIIDVVVFVPQGEELPKILHVQRLLGVVVLG